MRWHHADYFRPLPDDYPDDYYKEHCPHVLECLRPRRPNRQ